MCECARAWVGRWVWGWIVWACVCARVGSKNPEGREDRGSNRPRSNWTAPTTTTTCDHHHHHNHSTPQYLDSEYDHVGASAGDEYAHTEGDYVTQDNGLTQTDGDYDGESAVSGLTGGTGDGSRGRRGGGRYGRVAQV